MFIGGVVGLTAEDGMEKLLLAARKVRRATCTDFVISLAAGDFSRASSTYVGKLRLVLLVHLFYGLNFLYVKTYRISSPGPIFWAPSSLYSTASLHAMWQFNQLAGLAEDSIPGRSRLEYLHLTTE